jgi:AbrB family looped-hinge helix DNA binding protein
MTASLTVDEAGRVVLPKPVREALGIAGRTRLKVDIVGNVAKLSCETEVTGPVKREGGRLVYAGPVPEGWNSGEAVSKMRAGRIKR